jgi:hypothetical protein
MKLTTKVVTEDWHEDESGNSKPHRFVGQRYFHAKSSHVYTVTRYSLDAERCLWVLHYQRESGAVKFGFTHTIADFTREGRFIQIKE